MSLSLRKRKLFLLTDFTEFEQRAAYFDGDHVMAAKKGVNVLDRGTQVHHIVIKFAKK